VATTNHPERLDPAILNRPSRFDRKFTFELPDADARSRFLSSFGSRLEPQLHLNIDALNQISMLTEGFSFAYLKELYVSSIMEWMGSTDPVSVEIVMTRQCSILAEEMKSGIKDEEPENRASNSKRRPPVFSSRMKL
jgi:SpoVK/Ycf46/Vps4 family AAA+-type ATPase